MAELKIEARVTGLDEVKQLDKAIDDLEVTTKKSNAAVIGWTVGLAALATAVGTVTKAGHEYLTNLEDINNTIVTTTELENALSTSFGMASASILEQTGLWDAYREVLVSASNALDVVAGKEAIMRQARVESMAMEKEYQAMLKENAKWKAAEHTKELVRIKKEDDANVRHQQLLSSLEEKARQETESTAKQKHDAYEAELQANDAWIDATNAAIDKEIEHSQAIQDNTGHTEANTQATNDNSQATEKNTESKTFSSSGEMISGAESYAQHALGYNMSMPTSPSDRYLREIAESTRDTNDAVRGY
ncbi:MAG: hypothetical protein J7K75_06420 [Desulfuromonas sp.]|nr:hypothetical protein [Desulfuromonas sp.]